MNAEKIERQEVEGLINELTQISAGDPLIKALTNFLKKLSSEQKKSQFPRSIRKHKDWNFY